MSILTIALVLSTIAPATIVRIDDPEPVVTCNNVREFGGICGRIFMLEEMFQLQARLNERVGFSHTGDLVLDGEWLNDFITAAQSELCELRDTTFWKWFYKEAREGRRFEIHDLEHAKIEVVDILHYWISMAQALGMSASDVFELYKKKNQKNNERQDSDCTTQEAKGFEL